MRIFLTFMMLCLTVLSSCAELNLRNYDEFDIPEGTHVPVISLQEFSTAYCEEGDEVAFATTSDIFMYNKNVIPEGTKITGYIDKKNEPIIGTHGAMRVFVNKMNLSDGSVVPIRGYVYTSNNNIIGGGLTAPEKYINMPQYARWYMFRAFAVTRCVPGATRKMGEHVTISSGANLIIVLTEPIHMTHTVIN